MSLYVLDDYYPWLGTSFRIAEYNWYLRNIRDSFVFSAYREYLPSRAAFEKAFPDLGWRVGHLVDLVGKPDFFYNIFIDNAFDYLGIYEAASVPFAFTLYPGGGLHLNEPEADAKLQRVGASKLLTAIITTQTTSRDYILDKGYFPPEKVHFNFGGVADSEYFRKNYFPKKKYGQDKDTFDICFVATRYDPRGAAKGYDVFLEVARNLVGLSPGIRFHIVGDTWWDVEDEIDISFLGDKVIDHGHQDTSFFPEFHSGMDMILSPNKPFVDPKYPGAFDGFPTGCCVEAGMCGTAVLCTDLLDNNVVFEDGKDIRIIPYDVDGICDIVLSYYNNLDSLYGLGDNCRSSFLRVYDIDDQMSRRVELLGLDSYLQSK